MKKRIVAIAVFAALSSPLLADGIKVEPGLWSVTTTTQMPMLPAPQTVTVEECFEDDVMDMDELSTEDLDPDCTFEQGEVGDDRMTFTIDCPIEGGKMHAEWWVESAGDSATGEGKINMDMQGMAMEMTVSWEGERIGDCK